MTLLGIQNNKTLHIRIKSERVIENDERMLTDSLKMIQVMNLHHEKRNGRIPQFNTYRNLSPRPTTIGLDTECNLCGTAAEHYLYLDSIFGA
jgi:hypothetical protein